MHIYKTIRSWIDWLMESVALVCLTLMVVVISFQVFTRNVLSYTPSWGEAAAMILMVWFAFIGISIGIKENLHISIELFYKKFPRNIKNVLDVITKLLIIIVGIIFIYYGIQFTILMTNSTLAGTKLPSSVLYVPLPLAGILMTIYGIESLFPNKQHEQEHEWVEEE